MNKYKQAIILAGVKAGALCNFCGSQQIKKIWSNATIAIFLCQDCGVKFTHPMVKKREHAGFYNKEYFNAHYIVKENRKDKRIFEYILHNLNKIRTGSEYGKLLDIGCGDGFFMKLASLRGWDVQGIDSSDFAVSYASKNLGLNVVKGDAEDICLPESHFDVITLLDIVPHLFNPQRLFYKAHCSLKEKGIIVVKCLYRNFKYINTIKKSMFFRKDKGAFMMHLPHAFFHFEPESLVGFMHKNGFKKRLILNINHDRADYGYLLKHPRTLFYSLLNKGIIILTQPATHFLIFAEKT